MAAPPWECAPQGPWKEFLCAIIHILDTGRFGLHATALGADGSHVMTASDAWFREFDTAMQARGTTFAHVMCLPGGEADATAGCRQEALERMLALRPASAHARDNVRPATLPTSRLYLSCVLLLWCACTRISSFLACPTRSPSSVCAAAAHSPVCVCGRWTACRGGFVSARGSRCQRRLWRGKCVYVS